MRKKLVIALALGAIGVLPSLANITVVFPKGAKQADVKSQHIALKTILENRSEADMKPTDDVVKKTKKGFVIETAGGESSRYQVSVAPDQIIDLYASPDENIIVDVTSINPLEYNITGSGLMSDMDAINKKLKPLEEAYAGLMQKMRAGGEPDLEAMEKISNDFEKVCVDFVSANPDSEAVAYAVTNLSGKKCVNVFESMTEKARRSPLYPFAERQYAIEKERVAAREAREAMVNNHIEAPDFTLNDVNGEPFTLSSLRGKYVVLDFWGSWCIWCIKGFPELKANYEKYNGAFEVVGIDCNDSQEAWKGAVEKYKLPWINVYNPDQRGEGLLAAYQVQGFPTKIIIDPEGKIVDVTVGEDPSFYTKLAGFLSK